MRTIKIVAKHFLSFYLTLGMNVAISITCDITINSNNERIYAKAFSFQRNEKYPVWDKYHNFHYPGHFSECTDGGKD